MDMNHEWPVTMALLTVGLVMLAVFIHYEALNFLSRNLRRISEAPRPRILVLVPFILLTHVIEIWVFTAGYLLAMQLGLGTLAGDFNNTLQEVAYFSAVTYTTVGFGDIVPQGDLRLLVGTEALAGLVLITWSASFTFIEMQRFWRD